MAKKAVKQANTSRAKKIAEHEKQSEIRAKEVGALKSAYRSEDAKMVLDDILSKARKWQALNGKVAQDGVGARATGYKLQDGSPEVENVHFTLEQRVSYLDKNAGIQMMLDYIERQMGVLPEAVGVPVAAEAEDSEESTK